MEPRGGRALVTMGNLTRMRSAESRRRAQGGARVVRGISALALLAGRVLGAQSPAEVPREPARIELGGAVLSGGEYAGYLRALSLLDSSRAVSWSIQPLTRTQERLLGRLTAPGVAHPWSARTVEGGAAAGAFARRGMTRAIGGAPIAWRVLRPEFSVIYNSALPVGMNDGVLWAGRGTTVAAQAGVAAEWKFLRFQLAPIAFRAENADFEIAPNGQTGHLLFGDARYPRFIDVPQRFGDDAYGRFDWGDSFLEATLGPVQAGFSTARLQWSPARDHNLVLGTNSGGFPHFFAGTSKPFDIRIGTINTRLIAGRMEQSAYSRIQTGPLHRFHSALIGTFTPVFAPGLELGATRSMNVRWREGMPTLAQVFRAFGGVINDQVGSINQNEENQFATLFARFAPPTTGFEAYGEYSREDFSGNWRWLILQPDDLAGITFGFAHARRRRDGTVRVLRGEMVNADVSHHERLGRTLVRPIPLYWHVHTFQGYTSRGQLLGSVGAYGGAASNFSLETFHTRGRDLIAFERVLSNDWNASLGPIGGVRHPEVRYGVRYERVRLNALGEIGVSVAPSWTLNRLLEEGNDVFNLNVQVRWRGL
jgi:hypothetical protein